MTRNLGYLWLGSFVALAIGAGGCTALNDFSPYTFGGGGEDAGRSDAGRDAGSDDDAGVDSGMPCSMGCETLDDACNRGECDESTRMCVRVPLTDGTGCDDGDACTSDDVCGDGACAGAAIDCSGLTDDCNVGACDATGTCVATPVVDGTSCTLAGGGDPCTVGMCSGGACAGVPRDCSGLGDACHMGICDPGSGACAALPLADGTACDDGDGCTMDDVCTAEVCGGAAIVCPPAPDDCNTPICDPATGACGFASVPDGTNCEDGLPCTGGDTCSAGVCLPGGPVGFTGDACGDPFVLDARDGLQTISGTITSCHSDAGAGSCGGAGVDVVYRLDLGAPRRVRFETVPPPGGGGYDTLLHLRTSCATGGGGSELACDDNGGGAGGLSRITRLLAPGTYFLFVDAAIGATSSGAYELEVDIVTPDACASAVPLALPAPGVVRTITGNTTGAMNTFTTTCGGTAASPDHVYEFTVTTPTRIRFQTVMTTGMFDTVLHVRTSPCVDGLGTTLVCNDDFTSCCLSRIEQDFAPGTYYLIVDGFSMGNQGPYTLEIETSPAMISEWRFTTCGATGATGPTAAACASAYAGTPLEGAVTVTPGGQQQWMVPAAGTYRIEAVGAQGVSATAALRGGRGARIEGTFTLAAGEVLTILAGQEGTQDGCNGGGGGGTFVSRPAPAGLIIAAAGGGGTRTDAMTNGCDGRTSQEGGTASGGSPTHTCAARAGGLRQGGIASSSSWGSGGGGMDTAGGADCSGTGGGAYTAGGAGGTGASFGGFGGGGSGNGCCGGGGGGGYSGGDGGWVAGGGGSFNSGSAPVNTAGANAGPGGVVIRRL